MAPAKNSPSDLRQDFLLGQYVKIDKDISAENHIERSESAKWLPEIKRLELYSTPYFLFHSPLQPFAFKVFEQQRSRQSASDLEWNSEHRWPSPILAWTGRFPES